MTNKDRLHAYPDEIDDFFDEDLPSELEAPPANDVEIDTPPSEPDAKRIRLSPQEKLAAMEALLGRSLPETGSATVRCIDPAHEDVNPSCSVYADGGFKCFACGVHGDAVNAVALVEGLDPKRDFPKIAKRIRELAAGTPAPSRTSSPTFSAPRSTQTKMRSATRIESLEGNDHIKAMAEVFAFLSSRGFSPKYAFEQFRLDAVHVGGKPALAFRATNSNDDSADVVGARVVADVPKNARYVVPAGPSSNALIEFRADKPRSEDCIVITEGAMDAMTAAMFAGVHAFSLPNGANMSQAIKAAVGELIKTATTVVIATDNDDPGDRAAAYISETLYDAGLRDIRRAELPSDTKDLNEVLLRHGKEAVGTAITNATPFFPPTAPESWLTPVNRAGANRDPRPYILDGLIREGDRAFLAGRGETMKTGLALDIAIALAAGDGQSVGPFRVLAPRGVIFVNEEMNEHDEMQRVQRLALGRGLSLDALGPSLRFGHFPNITFDGEGIGFTRLETLLRQEIGLVLIYDSTRHLLGKINENEASGVLAGLKKLEKPFRAGRHTFIGIAHEVKSTNGAPWQRMAGSGAFYNWADLVVSMKREGREEKVTFSVTKGRNLATAPGPFDLELRNEGDGLRFDWAKAKHGGGDTEHDRDSDAAAATSRKRPRRFGVQHETASSKVTEAAVLAELAKHDAPTSRKALLQAIIGSSPHAAVYEMLDAILGSLERAGRVVVDNQGRTRTVLLSKSERNTHEPGSE